MAKTSRKRPRSPLASLANLQHRSRTIAFERCDGRKFFFNPPFSPGEVRQYMAEPKSASAVCSVTFFGKKELAPIAHYGRNYSRSWRRVR